MPLTRRQLLASAAATITLAALPGGSARATGNASTLPLAACRRTIEVNGRAATVLGLLQPDGRSGVVLEPGQRFRVGLENRLDEPTLVHWHGQTPPMDQDGVPGAVQPPLLPGTGAAYDFAPRPGTHWMHSHIGLQEQMLLAAPLIVREGSDEDVQEVVLMLHDFTFRPPAEVLADLQAGPTHGVHDQATVAATPVPRLIAVQQAMVMSQRRLVMSGYDAMTEHLHDIQYDAYLANDRTLADPEVVRVSPGGRVRLRVINGASATSFHLDLGTLPGSVVAVDGNPVAPFSSSRFLPLAMGQRLDVLLALPPRQQGAWPILALREGDTARTGLILATPLAPVARLAERGERPALAIEFDLEASLRATVPLTPRPATRRFTLTLGGGMDGYRWTIDDSVFGEHAPRVVRKGERIEITFLNMTPMMHPMHLHGHHFQVIGLNGQRFSGAMRDTVMVPAHGSAVTVAFDAGNPGEWMLHCHNLYHMAAGMMTTLRVE